MSEQNDGQRKLRGIGSGVTKRVRSAGEGASKKARSAREAAGEGAAAVGGSRSVGAIKSAGGSVVEGAGGAASRGSDAAPWCSKTEQCPRTWRTEFYQRKDPLGLSAARGSSKQCTVSS